MTRLRTEDGHETRISHTLLLFCPNVAGFVPVLLRPIYTVGQRGDEVVIEVQDDSGLDHPQRRQDLSSCISEAENMIFVGMH